MMSPTLMSDACFGTISSGRCCRGCYAFRVVNSAHDVWDVELYGLCRL